MDLLKVCSLDSEVIYACRGAGSVPEHSLIVAVRDRHAALSRALPSWLAVDGLDELVIVDWGSSAPLAPHVPDDPRIRLVVAPLEPEWTLSRAYNLAAQVARGAQLLKVDFV